MSTTTTSTPPPTPASVLRESLLNRTGLSQRELARALGVSEPRLSMVLHGIRPISVDIALRLGRVFGIPPEFWLQVQSQYELFEENERLRGELESLRRLAA